MNLGAIAPVVRVLSSMFQGGPRTLHEAKQLSEAWARVSREERYVLHECWKEMAPRAHAIVDAGFEAKLLARIFVGALLKRIRE